jgi:hypothetical protein
LNFTCLSRQLGNKKIAKGKQKKLSKNSLKPGTASTMWRLLAIDGTFLSADEEAGALKFIYFTQTVQVQ